MNRVRAAASELGRLALPVAVVALVPLVAITALIAEIAAAPTAAPGVASSTWTPTSSVAAAAFGRSWMHGTLALGSVLGGALLLAAASFVVAVPCLALLLYALGDAPHPTAAMLLGAALGLAAQIAVLNLLLNWLQPDNGVYRSLPSWGWWVALVTWGAALGLAAAGLRRGDRPAAVERTAAAT